MRDSSKDLLVYRASIFAKCAHNSIDQRRKYTNEPYWHHPQNVADIVACNGGDGESIAAAWLHDVLEDVEPLNPYFNQDRIYKEFGKIVLSRVIDLTDISTPEDGNRAKRKEIDRIHTASICAASKLIKLADIIDNSKSILKYDPKFAKVYLKEKELLLPYLRCASEDLYIIALDQVTVWKVNNIIL